MARAWKASGVGNGPPDGVGESAANDLFGPEETTTDRLRALRAAGEVLDGVLREARQLTLGMHGRVEHGEAGAGRLVLVVDDVEDTREMYARALRAAGFRAIEARDGREAIDTATAALPDVVVMDYAMPRMDGAEATRRLAGHPRTDHIPVIIISAYADEVPRDVRLGCAAFLPKPCAPDRLVALLPLVLGARSPGG
jgi:CheY-like chemotaxis protein